MPPITSRVWIGFALSAFAAAGAHAEGSADCARLAHTFKSAAAPVEVTSELIDASAQKPWVVPDVVVEHTPAERRARITQPFCRVVGSIHPTVQSNIGFEVWLPSKEHWNGKFFGTATGGSAGTVQYDALVTPLSRGYASMGQDNGHISKTVYEQSWAVDADTHQIKTEKVVDFAHRAQHLATVVGKELSTAYYSKAVRRAYYVGCSQGGHHGMMEAQRYPNDYDGIVAGALANEWVTTLTTEAWASTAMLRDNRSGELSLRQLHALHAAVLKSCDGLDGLVDGQIDDPRKCQFDPATLQCGRAGASGDDCLTSAQIAAIQKIYDGLRRPDSEQPVALPYNRGSEGQWNTTWTAGSYPPSGSFYDFYRLLVHQNPDWNFLTLDWTTDVDAARSKLGGLLDAVSPDLSAFNAHGGKLIMFHGWADPLIPGAESVETWNAITRTMGAEKAHEFVRLFMVPGMGHCGGGPIGAADWLSALELWVEQGQPPDGTTSTYTIIGSGHVDQAARTRPYCPYPQVAHYKGSGDINRAESFSCAAQ
jgi:feruloyl esterase